MTSRAWHLLGAIPLLALGCASVGTGVFGSREGLWWAPVITGCGLLFLAVRWLRDLRKVGPPDSGQVPSNAHLDTLLTWVIDGRRDFVILAADQTFTSTEAARSALEDSLADLRASGATRATLLNRGQAVEQRDLSL